MLDELNCGRPAEFVPKVEEEPVYTTRSTVATMVSGNGTTAETTKAPQTTTTAPTTGNPDYEKPPKVTVP